MTVGGQDEEQAAAPSVLALPAAPGSAALARRFVRNLLRARGADETADVAVLLTSEVVANAVLHAGTEVTVRASVDDEGVVRVEVSDADDHLPVVAPPSDPGPEAERGRGLFLVDVLSRRWAAEPRPGPSAGKTVWFEVSPQWAAERGA